MSHAGAGGGMQEEPAEQAEQPVPAANLIAPVLPPAPVQSAAPAVPALVTYQADISVIYQSCLDTLIKPYQPDTHLIRP